MEDPAPGPWEARLGSEAIHGKPEERISAVGGWSYGVVVALSLLLWDVASVIHYAVRWSQPAAGVAWGLLHAVFVYPLGWAIAGVPWLIIVYRLWLRMGWEKGRAIVALAPMLAFLVWQIMAASQYQMDPRGRFESLTHTTLPQGIMAWVISGGGLVDERDAFLIHCTPAETDTVISSLKLERVIPEEKVLLRAWKNRNKQFHWLNNEEWGDPQKYSSLDHPGPKFFELWTNTAHDRFLVIVADN